MFFFLKMYYKTALDQGGYSELDSLKKVTVREIQAKLSRNDNSVDSLPKTLVFLFRAKVFLVLAYHSSCEQYFRIYAH